MTTLANILFFLVILSGLATLGMLAILSQAYPSVYEGIAAKGVAALLRLAGD